MKTQFISVFCGLVISSLVINSSFSQVSEFKNLKPAFVTSSPVKVYQNILDEFHKQFAGAKNVRWSRLNEKFLANFTMLDQRYAVLFKPQATFVYKIAYGKEKHLPADIRRWVKHMYIDFIITSAIEVEQAGRIVWLINVEDDTSFAWVRVENEEIEEIQKYTKSSPL